MPGGGGSRAEGGFPGAMYPPGYVVVDRNVDYVEKEDELDVILGELEGFDFFENVGRERGVEGMEEEPQQHQHQHQHQQKQKQLLHKTTLTRTDIINDTPTTISSVRHIDEDEIFVDVVGFGGGEDEEEEGEGLMPIVSVPLPSLRQPNIVNFVSPSPEDGDMEIDNTGETVSSSIFDLMPYKTNPPIDPPATYPPSNVSECIGELSKFSLQRGTTTICTACNGRASVHICGRRFLPAYDPDFVPPKKPKLEHVEDISSNSNSNSNTHHGNGKRKRCGGCAGCKRVENCGRCSSCVLRKEFGGQGSQKGHKKCELKKCLEIVAAEQYALVNDPDYYSYNPNDYLPVLPAPNVPKVPKVPKVKAVTHKDISNFANKKIELKERLGQEGIKLESAKRANNSDEVARIANVLTSINAELEQINSSLNEIFYER